MATYSIIQDAENRISKYARRFLKKAIKEADRDQARVSRDVLSEKARKKAEARVAKEDAHFLRIKQEITSRCSPQVAEKIAERFLRFRFSEPGLDRLAKKIKEFPITMTELELEYKLNEIISPNDDAYWKLLTPEEKKVVVEAYKPKLRALRRHRDDIFQSNKKKAKFTAPSGPDGLTP